MKFKMFKILQNSLFIFTLLFTSHFLFPTFVIAVCPSSETCKKNNCTYSASAATGQDGLNQVNGDCLKDGDVGIVTTAAESSAYSLDADCSIPIDVCADTTNITPASNPGNKRWILVKPKLSKATTDDLPEGAINKYNLFGSAIESAEIADGEIVNADISDSAAIADSKLAQISTVGKVADSALPDTISSDIAGNAATATNAIKFQGVTSVDATEFSALDGVASNIQIQIDNKTSELTMDANGNIIFNVDKNNGDVFYKSTLDKIGSRIVDSASSQSLGVALTTNAVTIPIAPVDCIAATNKMRFLDTTPDYTNRDFGVQSLECGVLFPDETYQLCDLVTSGGYDTYTVRSWSGGCTGIAQTLIDDTSITTNFGQAIIAGYTGGIGAETTAYRAGVGSLLLDFEYYGYPVFDCEGGGGRMRILDDYPSLNNYTFTVASTECTNLAPSTTYALCFVVAANGYDYYYVREGNCSGTLKGLQNDTSVTIQHLYRGVQALYYDEAADALYIGLAHSPTTPAGVLVCKNFSSTDCNSLSEFIPTGFPSANAGLGVWWFQKLNGYIYTSGHDQNPNGVYVCNPNGSGIDSTVCDHENEWSVSYNGVSATNAALHWQPATHNNNLYLSIVYDAVPSAAVQTIPTDCLASTNRIRVVDSAPDLTNLTFEVMETACGNLQPLTTYYYCNLSTAGGFDSYEVKTGSCSGSTITLTDDTSILTNGYGNGIIVCDPTMSGTSTLCDQDDWHFVFTPEKLFGFFSDGFVSSAVVGNSIYFGWSQSFASGVGTLESPAVLVGCTKASGICNYSDWKIINRFSGSTSEGGACGKNSKHSCEDEISVLGNFLGKLVIGTGDSGAGGTDAKWYYLSPDGKSVSRFAHEVDGIKWGRFFKAITVNGKFYTLGQSNYTFSTLIEFSNKY